MKALLALACLLGAAGLVVGLGMTSSSCGQKDGVGFGTSNDDDEVLEEEAEEEEEEEEPVEGCEVPRTDCPASAELTGTERDDLLEAEGGGAKLLDALTSAWGWSSGIIDFTCCRVSSATVSGTASAAFELGWVGIKEDSTPTIGSIISLPAGSFSQEITFTAENELKGIYVSTGAETEEELAAFDSLSVVFEVEPL